MSTAYGQPAGRRRMHYVDRSVQRSLLVALVVLEVALVAASTWQVHAHLNELIEESLYRVHLAHAGPTLARLAQETIRVLGVFAAVNVAALVIAEGIWSRHENRVIRDFTALIGKTGALDFSADSGAHPRHEVLELALAWRAGERARLAAIREQVAALEAMVSAGRDPQDIRSALERVRGLLRPRARTTVAASASP